MTLCSLFLQGFQATGFTKAVPHIDHHYVSRMYRLDEEFFMSPDNPDCYNYSSDSRREAFRDCAETFAWQFALVGLATADEKLQSTRLIPAHACRAVACDASAMSPCQQDARRLMLSWISLLTAAHFFLNVRWFMLIPTQLAGPPVVFVD